MAKKDERLSALRVSSKLPTGMHADGKGLYLHVSTAGAKSWIFRYMFRGAAREMGLGSLSTLPLAAARAERDKYRNQLKMERKDPLEARKAQAAQEALEQAKSITFKEAAEQYINSQRAGWKNAKHAAQWPNTLAAYAYPTLGQLSVQAIDTALVCKVLEQTVAAERNYPAGSLWTARPETANRLRGRIEVILDWAKSRGLRDGENPARWRGHLEFQFPARSKVRAIEHHAALPYAELPAFLVKLREQEGLAARALEFTILTAARTGETIGATWSEFNLADKIWTVPGARMKARKEHRVPLSGRALAILRGAAAIETSAEAFVFGGRKRGKAMSNMAMLALLGRMGCADLTVHGFRSAFRDWAAERTNFPSEVVEMALAHAVGDKVEAAYRRGDLFEKRRRLMAEWATFCNTPAKAAERGSVVQLHAG
jgi:integrase